MSDVHHQILVMRELEGLSYREIGERLDMSRPSVESTLFRARRRLTEEYEDLRTGARCLRIQEIIERVGATAAALGTRDQRRVGSHISHCQPCRKHAVMAGMDAAALGRRSVRGKLAAFLPLPAVLRKRWFGGDGGGGDVAAAHAAHHGPALAQMSMAAAQYGEPSMAGWMKATAVVTAVAIAGLGAGAADHAVKGAEVQRRPGRARGAGARGEGAGGGRLGDGWRAGRRSRGRPVRRARVTGPAGRGGAGREAPRARRASAAAAVRRRRRPARARERRRRRRRARAAPARARARPRPRRAAAARRRPRASRPAVRRHGPVQQAAGAVSGAAGAVTDAVAARPAAARTAPLVDPNLGALTQPSSNPPPESVGQVVSGTTDVVGNTVGGQAGEAVKQTGAAVGSTVDHVTQGVTGAVGGLLGGK